MSAAGTAIGKCPSPAAAILLLSLLLMATFPRVLNTPLGPPPRARQFVDKRSSASRTTVAELLRNNPLLASLAMFHEIGGDQQQQQLLLQEPVDITGSDSLIHLLHFSALNQSSPSSPLSTAIRAPNRSRIGRPKGDPSRSSPSQRSNPPLFGRSSALALLANSSGPNQHLDNFEPLYQMFNATLFDLALPMEEAGREGARTKSRVAATPAWKFALPWAIVERREEEEGRAARNGTAGRRQRQWQGQKDSWPASGTTTTNRPREGRLLLGNGLEEEQEQQQQQQPQGTAADSGEPFVVTDSLRLALSTAASPLGDEAREPVTLVGQEDFPAMGELERTGKAWKYPWERQRGEQQQSTSSPAPTSTSSQEALAIVPLPSVMPGASFYVDQHVSHGPYGREADTAPGMVYDPNVLERYGYSGMLPQMMADGQLVRFGQTNQRRTAHFGVAQQQRSAPVQAPTAPPAQPVQLVPAAAVFFIPPPPRLSMARSVGTFPASPSPVLPHSRVHGQATVANGSASLVGPRRLLGFWPTTPSRWEVEEGGAEGQQALETLASAPARATTTPASTEGVKMTPMGGNHLRWVPLDKLEKLARLVETDRQSDQPQQQLQFDMFEEFGEASKYPCRADPPELVLVDFPTDFGPALSACFRRVRQCVLHMARPLERRVGLSMGECVRLCVGQKQCQSVLFARPNAICDIFSIRNGTGAGRLLYHRDFDYLEAKQFKQMNLSQCWQAMAPEASDRPGKLVDSGDAPDSTTNSSSASPAPANGQPFARDAPRDICPEGRDIVVFKSQGYRLAEPSNGREQRAVGEPPPVLSAKKQVLGQQSSETECIFSCLVNLARGRTGFECLAATFDQVQSSCLLYGPGSAADGSVHLVPDPSFAHYEKGCIREGLVELCQGLPIVRYPQKTLLGFALGSRRANSLIECLELCWAHNTAGNENGTAQLGEEEEGEGAGGGGKAQQKCRSVVFFYEESGGGHNCMLNGESRDTAPAFFVDENEALVDYASFDGCFRAIEGEEGEGEGELTIQELGHDLEAALREGGEQRERAVLGQSPKIQPKSLSLRPLPERRRKPDGRRIYFTKNAGSAGIERRLARLVDSERPGRSRGPKLMRRHRGQTRLEERRGKGTTRGWRGNSSSGR